MDHYRQGDVLLIRVAQKSARARKVDREDGRIVLAHGEATGHAHAIESPEADLYEDFGGTRFLEVRETVQLVHEEHAVLTVEPAIYEVLRQREYTPGAHGSPVRD
jgi:hypothetical protein